MNGLCTVNGTDIYAEFGAFLAEMSADAHTNMDELLAMPTVKEYTAVDFRERCGEELPETLDVQLQPIERTLQFCIVAESETVLRTKFKAFVTKLISGWLNIAVKDMRTYRMFYLSCDPPEWHLHDPKKKAVVLKVKFREPKPSL